MQVRTCIQILLVAFSGQLIFSRAPSCTVSGELDALKDNMPNVGSINLHCSCCNKTIIPRWIEHRYIGGPFKRDLDVVVDSSTSTTVVDIDSTSPVGEEDAIKIFKISINTLSATVLDIIGVINYSQMQAIVLKAPNDAIAVDCFS